MRDKTPDIGEQILDLLLDALQERLQQRQGDKVDSTLAVEPDTVVLAEVQPESDARDVAEGASRLAESEAVISGNRQQPTARSFQSHDLDHSSLESGVENADPEPALLESLPTVHLDRMLRRLALIMVALLLLINIPFNRYGTSLARAMPDSAALIIRDGLVLKGSGEKIYVLQNNQRRWIATLEAFEHFGYRWSQVHQVEDDFLNKFELGLPIHLLLKCQTSPHVYALEDGKKRWIKDIPTFESQGYLWEDVQFVACSFLRELPDGLPIPEDAGLPPQPER